MNITLLVLRAHKAHMFFIIHKSVFMSQNDTSTHSKQDRLWGRISKNLGAIEFIDLLIAVSL